MRQRLCMAGWALAMLVSTGVTGEASKGALSISRGVGHAVYFTLKDNSATKRQELVAALQKLAGAQSQAQFYCVGLLGEPFNALNDLDFDVSLFVIFPNQAALEAYDASPAHKAFIRDHRANWRKVRVFDSAMESGQVVRK